MAKVYDYLIVGAGTSGLGIASLLQKEKVSTLTLDAHYYPGGCASYFVRNKFCFDVGATTLSGIKNNGPLKQFINATNLSIELKKIDPGIISLLNQYQIKHYSNIDLYADELNKLFPDDQKKDLIQYLNQITNIEHIALDLINQNLLPKRNFLNLLELIKLNQFKNIDLIKLLFISSQNYIPNKLLQNENFNKIISEILFITTQNNLENTPALFGVLGAKYPSDTYYPMGGMRHFINQLVSIAGEIKLNCKVEKIIQNSKYYFVKTNKENFIAKNIISSLPHENNLILLGQEAAINQNAEKWSAFSLYFTVPALDLDSLYYQIHTDKIPHINTNSFFVSFSHPEDHSRNINQRLTVTISTHAKYDDFDHLTQEEYQNKKNEIKNFILNHFCYRFKLHLNEILNIEIGTPKTFERFTNRFHGEVGGIGHHLNQTLLSRIYYSDIKKNFFEIGDNIMPGQGVSAVLYGALALKDYLNRRN